MATSVKQLQSRSTELRIASQQKQLAQRHPRTVRRLRYWRAVQPAFDPQIERSIHLGIRSAASGSKTPEFRLFLTDFRDSKEETVNSVNRDLSTSLTKMAIDRL